MAIAGARRWRLFTRMVTEGFGESWLGQLKLRTGDSLVDCL